MKKETEETIAVTYAWGHESTGDMAIAPGLIKLLRQALPDVRPVLYASAADASHARTANYLHTLEPALTVFPDPFARLMGQGTPEELSWRYFSLLLRPESAIGQGRRIAPEAMDAWLGADLRLFNSSMQLSHRRDGGQFRYWLPNALSQQLRLPYALWSQSFGKIDFPGLEMLKIFLADAELVTSRDERSLELLQSLPLEGPALGYTADPILFFDSREPAWADNFLCEQNLRPQRFLVVLPRTFEFWGEPTPAALLDERLSKLAAAIERWIERTGQQVLIAHEMAREKERVRLLLWPKLTDSSRQHCRFFTGDWNSQQALAVFERASAMLSMERYSVYLGLTAGTVVLHPTSNAISLRMDVLDRMGLGRGHLMIDTLSAGDLEERLLGLYQERDEYLKQAAIGVARMKSESVQTMRSLWSRSRARKLGRTCSP